MYTFSSQHGFEISLYYHHILAAGKLGIVDSNDNWFEGNIIASLIWDQPQYLWTGMARKYGK